VAAYLGSQAHEPLPCLGWPTIHRYRGPPKASGNCQRASPELTFPTAPLAVSAGPSRRRRPLKTRRNPTLPATAWGPGWVSRRQVRPDGGRPTRPPGVVHIFTRPRRKSCPERHSPVNFLGRVSPALQSCIIEAAELYRCGSPDPGSHPAGIKFHPPGHIPKGAMGLMQLMPGTAASLGGARPLRSRKISSRGGRIFRQLLDLLPGGNVPLGLGWFIMLGRNPGNLGGLSSSGHQRDPGILSLSMWGSITSWNMAMPPVSSPLLYPTETPLPSHLENFCPAHTPVTRQGLEKWIIIKP